MASALRKSGSVSKNKQAFGYYADMSLAIVRIQSNHSSMAVLTWFSNEGLLFMEIVNSGALWLSIHCIQEASLQLIYSFGTWENVFYNVSL